MTVQDLYDLICDARETDERVRIGDKESGVFKRPNNPRLSFSDDKFSDQMNHFILQNPYHWFNQMRRFNDMLDQENFYGNDMLNEQEVYSILTGITAFEE